MKFSMLMLPVFEACIYLRLPLFNVIFLLRPCPHSKPFYYGCVHTGAPPLACSLCLGLLVGCKPARWMQACSLDASLVVGCFFLNHIAWCGLDCPLDASLLIGCKLGCWILSSYRDCSVWLSLLVGRRPAHWMQAWSLDVFFLITMLGVA